MMNKTQSKLDSRKRYLQVALNSTLEDARQIIFSLPKSDRIIVEVGTPFIKRFGEHGIRLVRNWYANHLTGGIMVSMPMPTDNVVGSSLSSMFVQSLFPQVTPRSKSNSSTQKEILFPYIVADMKTMDRGDTEVRIAASGGASAVIALGTAPTQTLDTFIAECDRYGMDAMIDMMNVEFPLSVLRALKKPPRVVIIHRGVDEERLNREKQIPLHEIRRIKGNYNMMIAIAGGDTLREVQRSIFNDADIVVVWKSVFQKTSDTASLVEGFLKEIK